VRVGVCGGGGGGGDLNGLFIATIAFVVSSTIAFTHLRNEIKCACKQRWAKQPPRKLQRDPLGDACLVVHGVSQHSVYDLYEQGMKRGGRERRSKMGRVMMEVVGDIGVRCDGNATEGKQ
jgi:hypothetical protein